MKKRMHRLAQLTILVFILFAQAVLSLQWSEILFNPEGNDNGKEFVELVGSEDLSACSIHDSASADTLVKLQSGGDMVLIVETDSALNSTAGATIYGAGAAIGNGLGNTNDSLAIVCNGTTLLQTSYNANDIAEGESLVFHDGWVRGAFGGTPGAQEVTPQSTPEPAVDPKKPKSSSSGGGAYVPSCNTSLAITLSALNGTVGDTIAFTIISDAFASFTATYNKEIFAEGDTLHFREHTIVLPGEGEVVLTAYANQCDGKQRATRRIMVQTAPEAKNTTIIAPPVEVHAQVIPIVQATPEPAPKPIEREVIVDEDRNMIPWICGFGAVVLLVSAALFVHQHRSQETGKYISDTGVRNAHEREPDQGAHQAGLDPSDRHLRGGGQAGTAY